MHHHPASERSISVNFPINGYPPVNYEGPCNEGPSAAVKVYPEFAYFYDCRKTVAGVLSRNPLSTEPKTIYMKPLISGLLSLFLFTVFSCKKGDQGPPGTANVMYSAWVTTNPWVASTTSAGSGKKTYYFDITAAGVTQQVLDQGTVIVFAKFIADPDGPGSIKQLPSIYYNIGGADVQYRFQSALTLGKVRIICDIIPNGIPANTNSVRYVIIPGGVSSGRQINPRSLSYEELCKAYKIPL